MKESIFASIVFLTLAMLACSLGSTGSDKPVSANELQAKFDKLPAGDATRGEQIFIAQPCHTCHMDLPVGPVFPGEPPLVDLAATRRSGYPADLYLYESIVNPSAFVVEGFQSDVMPEGFGANLTRQELADLVAYLMTMK